MNVKLVCLFQLVALGDSVEVDKSRRFPDDFMFGSSTSAYQIEGASNVDGKSPNIWDTMIHNHPDTIKGGSNADVAADSYHLYRRDVEMLRELGLDFYRFSISWSRLLPNGYSNEVNPKAIEFYNNYINEMLKYNISPFVTLYHWDLPQSLQDLGGLANPLMADWFADYAMVAFNNFGDRVKNWITFNEPQEICNDGYGGTISAPQVNFTGVGEYQCFKNLIMSHASAFHLYDQKFRKEQGGKVGITVSIPFYMPYTSSLEDQEATELKNQAMWKLVVDPIFSSQGGYPREIVARVADKSAAQGYPRSRLVDLTPDEVDFIRGTNDFMGINHYRCSLISATERLGNPPVPSILDDTKCAEIKAGSWWKSTVGQFELPPHSLYNVLVNLQKLYNTTFIITENGIPDSHGFHDDEKVFYFRTELENVLDALDAGVNLKGYAAWSLMDNFEWIRGYTEYYGLYQVDFESANKTRTPRKSAFVFKDIVKNKLIDYTYEPKEDSIITID